MNTTPYVPPGGPPTGPKPDHRIFAALGEAGVFSMIEDFYRRLAGSEIRHLFPQTEAALIEASKRNASFFVQILGGPSLYSERFGPPQMRKRHLAFDITEAAKEVWLACFFEILDEAPAKYNFPTDHLESFKSWLRNFAAWMVNRAP